MNWEIKYQVPEIEIKFAKILLEFYKTKNPLGNSLFCELRDTFISEIFKTKIIFDGEEIYVAMIVVMSDVLEKEYQHSGNIKIPDKKLINLFNMKWKMSIQDTDIIQYVDYYNLPKECISLDLKKMTIKKIVVYIDFVLSLDEKFAWELNEDLSSYLLNFKFVMQTVEMFYISRTCHFQDIKKEKLGLYLEYYYKLMTNKFFRENNCDKYFARTITSEYSYSFDGARLVKFLGNILEFC